MIEIYKELTEKIEASFADGTSRIEKADLLGQALANMDFGCVSNDIRWFVGGLAYGHTVKTGAVQILKDLIQALNSSKITDKNKNYNYNDFDCDLKGWHHEVFHSCLVCSSRIESIKLTSPAKEDCTRCNGSGVDPQYKDDIYVVYFRDHGHIQAFIVIESPYRSQLHIREFPYNFSKEKAVEIIENMTQAAKEPQYDNKSTSYFSYRDGRDEGFIVSMSYSTPFPDGVEHELTHSCEASMKAINAIDTIAEHFPCVIDDLKENKL